MSAVLQGPTLWYLNRATGLVILALLTLTTVLGVLSTGGRPGRPTRPFVSQSLHRNLALFAVTALGVHIFTAVADSFVDIRWWQALVPWLGSTYMPLWLGLGTLAFDVMLVVTVTSLVRARMSHRSWRGIHLLTYAAWGLAAAHGLGIGTDLRSGGLGPELVWVAAGLVAAAIVVRLALLPVSRLRTRGVVVRSVR